MPIPLRPRPAPEPGRPFVDREDELKLIEEKIRPSREKGDPLSLAVVCFWGPFGVGKSWLLGELWRRYQNNGPQSSGRFRTVVAKLDLDPPGKPAPFRDAQGKLERTQLVCELWKQLASQRGEQVPALGGVSPEQTARQFIEHVTTWLAHASPVLILDALDSIVHSDEASFFWLEEHLVEPLALTDRVLFVFASRGELRRWKRFQVRRRVDLVPVKAFDKPELAGQEVKAESEMSQALFQHAFGHPLATERLATLLEEKGVNLKGAVAPLSVLEPSLVREALREIAENILSKVPADLKPFAKVTSILRWVNVDPLRHLAQSLNLAEGNRGEAFYQNLIGQFQACDLLYWNINTASYETDRAVRRLLAHSFELENGEQFRKAHLAALEYHRNHLNDYPRYLARYLPEVAFHSSMLRGYEPQLDKVESFSDWWEKFLTAKAPEDPAPWLELARALEPKAEEGKQSQRAGQELTGDLELRAALGNPDYERLLLEAKRRANLMPT